MRALADEFARGGIVVETHGCATTLQADGDLQFRIFEPFRRSSPECQARAMEAHFETVADRLRPLADAAEAAALARAGLGSLAVLSGGGIEAARAFGELTSVAFWLPHILTLVFAIGAALAPRLVWWAIRFQLRRRLRAEDPG